MGSAACSLEVLLPAPRRPEDYGSHTLVFWLWQYILTHGEHGAERTQVGCKASLLPLGETMVICACDLSGGSGGAG